MSEIEEYGNFIQKAKKNINNLDEEKRTKYLKKFLQNEENLKIVYLYNNIEEPKIKKYSKAVSFKKGELVVNTANPTVSYDLTFQKNKIMSTVNKMLGKKAVLDIYFKVGEIKRDEKSKENTKKEDPIKDIELDEETINKIDKMVESINDKALRESMRKLFISSKKAEKLNNN